MHPMLDSGKIRTKRIAGKKRPSSGGMVSRERLLSSFILLAGAVLIGRPHLRDEVQQEQQAPVGDAGQTWPEPSLVTAARVLVALGSFIACGSWQVEQVGLSRPAASPAAWALAMKSFTTPA